VPIQLAQYRFPRLAISSAKILIYFSNKIYGSNFIKRHSETVMVRNYQNADCTHTHPFNGPFSWTNRVGRYRKVKPIWILLKQETVSGSRISWALCKPASRSRQITIPAPHHSVFLQAGCPSCRPTNSVKALKAKKC